MRRADKVTASVSCASQADEALNYDKSIVIDFRDDRDHGGTILYGPAIRRLVMGSSIKGNVKKKYSAAAGCFLAFQPD